MANKPIKNLGNGKYTLDKEIISPSTLYDTLLSDVARAFVYHIEDNFTKNTNPKKSKRNVFIIDSLVQKPSNFLKILKMLYQSVIDTQPLSIKYEDKNGNIREFNIQPYRIGIFSSVWYLIAWDEKDKKIKSFYIPNIKNMVVYPDKFIMMQEIEDKIDKYFFDRATVWYNENQKECTIRVWGIGRKYLSRTLERNQVMEKDFPEKDEMLIRMIYYSQIEVKQFVKKWLPYARVENCPEIQNKIEDELRGYLGSKE